MHKQRNPNNTKESITIQAELPVPLGELAIYLLPKKEGEDKVLELLDATPHLANYVIGKIIRKILRKKKVEVRIKSLEHDYNDSQNMSHGVAYFKVILEGTKANLRKVAGENKLFFVDWQEQSAKENINS